MLRVRTILYPTDFSSYSNQAYLHAVAIAERHRASMTIMYVAGPDQKEDAEHWRGQLEQIKPANPKIPVSHVYLEGDAATETAQSVRARRPHRPRRHGDARPHRHRSPRARQRRRKSPPRRPLLRPGRQAAKGIAKDGQAGSGTGVAAVVRNQEPTTKTQRSHKGTKE